MKTKQLNFIRLESAGLARTAKNYLTLGRFGLIAFLFFVSVLSTSAQSTPAHSRYVADYQGWTQQDCMARAKWALETEGYKIVGTGGDVYRAIKGVYVAIILCDPTPAGTMRVNVIIAGNTITTMDENERLWMRLNNPGTSGTGGGQQGAGVNLALNRPARQSSTSEYSKPNDAQGAVDGVKNNGYGFCTQIEPNPWWQVDLEAVRTLTEIRIFNRIDYNPERARTIQVLLSNDGMNWTRVFANDGTVFGGNDGKPLKVSLRGYSARFVRLQLNETNYLHLDEVEIY